jgi:hypothetical protein
MSRRLPDGWTDTKGVSCDGWDITAAFNLSRPEGERFAVFRRRIADQEQCDLGRIYPTASAAEAAIDDIRGIFRRGKYSFEDLFPEEAVKLHPNYGMF